MRTVNVHDHPIVEQLVRDAAPRAAAPLPARERVVEAAVGLALVLAVAGLAIATGAPLPAPLNLAAGILAYMAARRVEFRVGGGTAGPTQPVLVVMLLTLPPWVAVIAVVVAALLDRMPAYLSGRMHRDHSLLTLGDAWHVVGPAVVLAAAGSPEADLDLWWLYLLAFAAQVVFDALFGTIRGWLQPPASRRRCSSGCSAGVFLVDAALSPVGVVAIVAVDQPAAPPRSSSSSRSSA